MGIAEQEKIKQKIPFKYKSISVTKEIELDTEDEIERLISFVKPIQWPLEKEIPPIPKDFLITLGDQIQDSSMLREVASPEVCELLARFYSDYFKFPMWSYSDFCY